MNTWNGFKNILENNLKDISQIWNMLHSVKCILKWRLRIDFNENKNCHHVGAIPNPIEKNHGKGQNRYKYTAIQFPSF